MTPARELDDAAFAALPLVVRGESKEVRDLGGGLVAIRFLPTVYSFTHNRAAVVAGTDALRLRATRRLVEELRAHGVDHAYIEVGERFVIARRVEPPPIEVVVKARHVGTPRHRYHGIERHPVRAGHPAAGLVLGTDRPYPVPYVRFDWRNPLVDETGRRWQDEVLPDELAELWIDVPRARATARRAFEVLTRFFATRGIVLVDICLFVTADGETVFGELGPDCARFRRDGEPLDKDVFRRGGSDAAVLGKYLALAEAIGA